MYIRSVHSLAMRIFMQMVLVVSIVLMLALPSMGQTVFQPKQVDLTRKGIIFDRETIIEIRPHLHGFAVAYKKGKIRTFDRTTYQSFELGYMKHPDERRQNKNTSISGERISSPFVFGKQNQLITLRASMGVKKYLSEKTLRKGVAMGFIYEGGATLGLIKPYYLKVIRLDDDNLSRVLETVSYDKDDPTDFLDFANIYGGTNMLKGFESITPTVGLHGKIGMHWALGAFERRAKAIEAGLQIDIFPGKVPLMIENDNIRNSFIFLKVYASLQLGSRKLRHE